jgi:putative membrane protein
LAAGNASTMIQEKDTVGNWLLRLVKGVIVGIGAIVPGLSGGVLALVLGLYQPLIRFLANLKENFIKNVLFFLPVGIGLLLGVLAFSAFVDFAFTNYAAQFTCLFIGFIVGTFPSLFKTAGEKGRRASHWWVLIIVAILTAFVMLRIETTGNISLSQTFINWVLGGALFGLGVVVPGMSPSNFLIYLGLYQPMASGIEHLDFSVIIPLGLGLIVCVFVFAKLMDFLFSKFYSFMYHGIIGIVLGSTLAIIPFYVRGWALFISILLFVFGVAGSLLLSRLDKRNPPGINKT